jgi:hypothetical protein
MIMMFMFMMFIFILFMTWTAGMEMEPLHGTEMKIDIPQVQVEILLNIRQLKICFQLQIFLQAER